MAQFSVVTFNTRYGSYNPGDVAGFPPDVSDKLIKLGVCTKYVEPAGEVNSSPKKALPPRRGATKIVKKGS